MKPEFNKIYFKNQFTNVCSSLFISSKALLKWLVCAVLSGTLIGLVGALFHHALEQAAVIRQIYPQLLFLLPVSGVLIVFLYKKAGKSCNKGTNLVIDSVYNGDNIPLRLTPLIIISTALTHLFGGSAGREGAALQVGGSLGSFLARLLKLDREDTSVMLMCGMSACFSALFGTPAAAAVFSIEVVNVGMINYPAIVPCVLSALIANAVSTFCGSSGTHFYVGNIPDLTAVTAVKLILISIIFSLAAILLCFALHTAPKLYKRYIKNEYLCAICAGVIVIALRYLFNTTDYLGAGTDIITKSFLTSSAWYVFLLKILFTAVTLGGGFKGGEIVPTLFVGATLGSFLAPLFGLPVGLCAACGMVSVFCGVTNCPIASIFLSAEMFGSDCITFCIICIAISYMLSGYCSLYHSQRFVYSKYKLKHLKR